MLYGSPRSGESPEVARNVSSDHKSNSSLYYTTHTDPLVCPHLLQHTLPGQKYLNKLKFVPQVAQNSGYANTFGRVEYMYKVSIA